MELHYILANNCFTKSCNNLFKMNKIVHEFLLTRENFMSEMPLAQPIFPYSACGPLRKHWWRKKKLRKTDNLNYSWNNEQDKALLRT